MDHLLQNQPRNSPLEHSCDHWDYRIVVVILGSGVVGECDAFLVSRTVRDCWEFDEDVGGLGFGFVVDCGVYLARVVF